MSAEIFEGNSFTVTENRLEHNGILTLESERAVVKFRYVGDSYTKEREEKCLDMRYLTIMYRRKEGEGHLKAGISNIRAQIFISLNTVDSLIEPDEAKEAAEGIWEAEQDARDVKQYMDYWFPEDCRKESES